MLVKGFPCCAPVAAHSRAAARRRIVSRALNVHKKNPIFLRNSSSSTRNTLLRPPRSMSDENAARSLQEAAALDGLIDMMLEAKSQQELATVVAQNIAAVDPRFWMRIATRNDSAPSQAEKDRLRTLADSVMALVDGMLKSSERRLNDSAAALQAVLAAAADANGEWYLPLAPEQVAAVRAALEARAGQLDEAFLSNAFAYIKKASDDRFDSLVQLLQKVLQLYAAHALTAGSSSGSSSGTNSSSGSGSGGGNSANNSDVDALLDEVLYAEEHEWAPRLRAALQGGRATEAAFTEALQRRMEATVLGLTSGSYAQRVQAEYLKELEGRARAVFAEEPSSAAAA